MKRSVTLAAFLLFSYAVSFSQKQIKTWSSARNLLGMSSALAESKVKESNFKPDGGRDTLGYKVRIFTDKNTTYDHPIWGDTEDEMVIASKDGKIVIATFCFGGSIGEPGHQFTAFEKSMLVDGFKLVRTEKDDEPYLTTKYYYNSARKENIRAEIHKTAGIVKAVDVELFMDGVDMGDGERGEGEKVQTASQTSDPYSFSTLQDFANTLNANMRSARIGLSGNTYVFTTLGKTDFDKRSLEFIVKDNQLYIRMNQPRNGTCDYASKEIPAKWTSQRSYNSTSFDYIFKYEYSCNNVTNKDLYISFNNNGTLYERATEKMKACCWK